METPSTLGHGAGCDLAPNSRPGSCAWCGSPLPPRRRRYCSDPCAYSWADNHVWSAAKQAARERAGYRCERCDARPTVLAVHHRVEVDVQHGYENGCQHHQAGLEVLCEPCHRSEHGFRREVDRLLRWADGVVSLQLELPLGV